MKISKSSILKILAMVTDEPSGGEKLPKYEVKGTHENAKPLPKKKSRKKRGW